MSFTFFCLEQQNILNLALDAVNQLGSKWQAPALRLLHADIPLNICRIRLNLVIRFGVPDFWFDYKKPSEKNLKMAFFCILHFVFCRMWPGWMVGGGGVGEAGI